MEFFDKEELINLIVEAKEAKKENEEKFEKIYDITWKYVYFLLSRKLKSDEEIQDIMQEVYLEAFKSLQGLQNERAFVSWLGKIVASKYADFIRANKKRFADLPIDNSINEIPEVNPDYNPEEVAVKIDEHVILNSIIEQLPTAQKESIKLHYFQNKSMSEIAQILKVPENVVRKRLFDGRKTIKSKIEKHYNGNYSLLSLASLPLLTKILIDNALYGKNIADISLSGQRLSTIINETNMLNNSLINYTPKIGESFTQNFMEKSIKVLQKSLANQTIAVVATVTVAAGSLAVVAQNINKNQEAKAIVETKVETKASEQITANSIYELASEKVERTETINEQINNKYIVATEVTEKVPFDITNSTYQLQQASTQESEVAKENAEIVLQTEIISVQTDVAIVSKQASEIPKEAQTEETQTKEVQIEKVPTNVPVRQTIQMSSKITYEIGEKISSENFAQQISNLLGNTFNYKNAKIDSFDISSLGTKTVEILAVNNDNTKDVKVLVEITVVDSQSPIITIENSNITANIGASLTKDEIIKLSNVSFSDNAGEELEIEVKGYEEINFDVPKDYNLTFYARDKSGNEALPRIIVLTVK